MTTTILILAGIAALASCLAVDAWTRARDAGHMVVGFRHELRRLQTRCEVLMGELEVDGHAQLEMRVIQHTEARLELEGGPSVHRMVQP